MAPIMQRGNDGRRSGRRLGSFAALGTAMPFTTALLVGSRARPTRSGKIELAVPSPSGGKGFYVFDMALVRDFCQLTVHDEMLLERLVDSPVVTPAAVRKAAREVALAGAAGRDAATSAQKAMQREEANTQLAMYMMILRLLRQIGVDSGVLTSLAGSDRQVRAELRARLGPLAPSLGLTLDELFQTLEDVAVFAATIGFTSGDFVGRHNSTLGALAQFRDSLCAWSAVEADEVRDVAATIVDCARWTLEEGRALIDECQTALDDVLGLLRAWRGSDAAVRERLVGCDWLLDGWQEPCAIWRSVAGEGRSVQRAALSQIERMLPVTTEEIQAACGSVATSDLGTQRSRWVKLNEDWKTGLVIAETTARREAVRAMVA